MHSRAPLFALRVKLVASELGATLGALVEWLDDVRRWRAGDPGATERLREYVTPFVHGALLARMPHHVANALMPQVLDQVLADADPATDDAAFVVHVVAVARRLARAIDRRERQERPSTDSTIAEGRQWLERLRGVPDEVCEQVVWRLVEGIPGPELVEVLRLDEAALRPALERGVGDSLVPPQSLLGADYLWDLSGEPSTSLARAETFAMSLRFDPLTPPEPADVVNTGATFQDLSNAKVGLARPEANPFGNVSPTRVLPPEPRSKANRLVPAGSGRDEKTEGAFDLPAAARGLVPKAEPAAPAVKTSSRPGPLAPVPTHRSAPKVAKVFDDDRPSKKRPPPDEGRKTVPLAAAQEERVGRKTTVEAPVEPAPSQTRPDDEDDRPSRSRLQARGKADRERPEESARRRNPEHEARRARPNVTEPEARLPISEPTPVGLSEPSLEATDPEAPGRARPFVTEKLVAQPVTPAFRLIAIGVGAALLLFAIAWRLGWFSRGPG